MTKLTTGCLILLTAFLSAYTTSPHGSKTAKAAFTCATLNNFHFEYDDFGWTGGPCGSTNIVEKYIVFHGNPANFTEPLSVEFLVQTGDYSETTWVTVYPGTTQQYVGKEWTEWNDMDCDGSMGEGEVVYHTYNTTGNVDCDW